jgi:isoquinoline 1-oxidoreductase beta subunit
MAHDFFRPGGFNSFRAAFDADNKMIGWTDHFISFSPDGKVSAGGPPGAPPPKGPRAPSYFPASLTENARTTQTNLQSLTPTGPFRAPGSNTLSWASQSFMDECAVACGKDYPTLFLEMLGEPRATGPGPSFHTGRARNVVTKLMEMSGWGRELPAGHGLGMAFFFSHQGHVGHVAEVSVDAKKRVTVHKFWSCGDVGQIVNLSGAENQIEGCVVDAISSLMLEIDMEDGTNHVTNFHQYPMRRIAGTPEVEIEFLQSDFSPTGLGEPGYPPAGPAICNAIHAATGERIRQMPISKQGFKI